MAYYSNTFDVAKEPITNSQYYANEESSPQPPSPQLIITTENDIGLTTENGVALTTE